MANIKCPYCFEVFKDDQVHFRSEKVSVDTDNPLPEGFDSIEQYTKHIDRLKEKKNNEVLSDEEKNILARSVDNIKKYNEWKFFAPKKDEKYEGFWSKFKQTTENNRADDRLGVKGYERPIIYPQLLKDNNINFSINSYNNNGSDGIVKELKIEGEDHPTKRRVCPDCHNPLPEGYGQYPVKYIAVVGITGAGKTVYLSQLLSNIKTYAEKVGISIDENSSSIGNFIKDYPVKKDEGLPAGTDKESFQQPLFYDISIGNEDGSIRKYTLVMYDVAGESFVDTNLVDKFAPFVEHANGVILLVSPSQLRVMERLGITQETKSNPSDVLGIIRDRINHGAANQKISLPVAVCISQADLIMKDELKDILGEELINNLIMDSEGARDPNGRYIKEFNAKHYNPIGKGLNDFFAEHGDGLSNYMDQQYENYAWFAFSALGCDVTEKKKEGTDKLMTVPIGPVNPKHIEDPLLWMFYRFGFIGCNEEVFSPGDPIIKCPQCQSSNLTFRDNVATDVIKEAKKGFFGFGKKEAETAEYDTICNECNYKWLRERQEN